MTSVAFETCERIVLPQLESFIHDNKVGSMNDPRPVALTSVALETYERIVLPQLKSSIHDSQDPFQFAYQNNRSCVKLLS